MWMLRGEPRFVHTILLISLPQYFSFKGQEDISSSTKVPSILYYDSDGSLIACGSEATDEITMDEDLIKVEWFVDIPHVLQSDAD